jgi:LL-diaminopimelate aminotransferase
MMKTRAQRMQSTSVQFFAQAAEKIRALTSAGHDVIRLDIGSPDLPPPAHVLEALSRSAGRAEHHGYQPHNATEALRQAWIGFYRRQYGIELDPNNQIVPLMGSKEGIFHLMMALIDPGDVVLVPDPGYLTYTQGATLSGGEPYYLPLEEGRGYLPDFDDIPADIARRARLMWLNYPNNPTAAVAPLEFFQSAVDFARQNDLLVCHDAAYGLVTFDGYQAPSLLQVPGAVDVAVEFNTLSKSHNMAGWRVGAALGNAQVLKSLYTLKTNADSGHFLPVLEAATAALEGDQGWLAGRNEIYKRRRDIVVEHLRRMGLAAQSPCASIYVWSPVPPGWECEAYAGHLLQHAHVSVAPGTVFGQNGEGYMRIALTADEARTQEAMQRMATNT